MSQLQVDHFFLSKVNHTISNVIVIVTCCYLLLPTYLVGNNNNNIANCMVYLAKKKVINLKMAHN